MFTYISQNMPNPQPLPSLAPLQSPQPAVASQFDLPRRSNRHCQPPISHQDYVRSDDTHFMLLVIHEGGESISYTGAIRDPKWVQAIKSEKESTMRNQVWTYVSCPTRIKPITARWLFKLKPGPANIPSKHKARVVTQRC